ncbi:MAG: hypothetical protein LIP01_03410 [Tannerellaceae bacterium]|nr:hypothetical protein [Tannerellaceae bacterium]
MIVVNQDVNITLSLIHSKAGNIVFKEIYCGGCTKYPQEGTYQTDKYFILHNNGPETEYLDSLCFGTLDPYNSNSTNVWVTADPPLPVKIYISGISADYTSDLANWWQRYNISHSTRGRCSGSNWRSH